MHFLNFQNDKFFSERGVILYLFMIPIYVNDDLNIICFSYVERSMLDRAFKQMRNVEVITKKF